MPGHAGHEVSKLLDEYVKNVYLSLRRSGALTLSQCCSSGHPGETNAIGRIRILWV